MGFFYSSADDRPRINSLQIQTAAYGNVIPIVFGTARVAGNIVDYYDYKEIDPFAAGKGGFSVVKSASQGDRFYSVHVEIAITEGNFASVGQLWYDKQVGNAECEVKVLGLTTSKEKVSFTDQLLLSHLYNEPLPYAVTYFPERALSYKNISRMSGEARLVNGKMPNITVEIAGLNCFDIANGLVDANPASVIYSLLTDASYGMGFSVSFMSDMTDYRDYCTANSLFLGFCMSAQEECRNWIEKICQSTNSAVVWSQGQLKFIPYGDSSVTANGVTWTPDLTPIYDVWDDDFQDKDNPVKAERTDLADAYNVVQVQFMNRLNDYNGEIAEAKDQGNAELYGVRTMAPINLDMVNDATTARNMAQLILQRSLYIRNKYSFTLGFKYCLLEPMDIITISDPGLGLVSHPVRIISIEETEDCLLDIVAEEVLVGVCSSPRYPAPDAQRAKLNYNIPSGGANEPIILEPDMALTNGNFEAWMAVSGIADTWGGAQVHFSEDGLTYTQIGNVPGRAKQGYLTSYVPSTADPDTDTTMGINVYESQAQIYNQTQETADNFRSLIYVDGEIMSYRDAILTATGQYNIKYLRRGLYNTTITAHQIDSKFARLDDRIFKYQFSGDLVGKTVYFKIASYNIWGGALQSLDQVKAFPYIVTGKGLLSPLPNVENLSYYVNNNQTFLQWSVITDTRDFTYEIRRGTVFETAQIVGTTKLNQFATVGDGTYWVTAKFYTAYSTTPISIVLTGTTIKQNTFYEMNERETGWTGSLSGGAIHTDGEIRLNGSGGVDDVAIVDEVAVWDTVDISVSPSGYYTIPDSHIPDLGTSQYGTLYTDSLVRMDSLQALFSQVSLVSALANVGGAYSKFGAAVVECALSTDGTNYGSWQAFTNGTYLFKTVKFRVKLLSYNFAITTILNDFSFGVDLPTRTAVGTNVTVPTGSLSVTFSTSFHVNPNVMITILDKQAGDFEYFSVAPNETGFKMAVINGGSPVERLINYSATGY